MKFGWKILAILLSASVRPDSTDVAPWDADHARAMFSASAPTDTIGLAPAWSIAVRDSGRRAELVVNRFWDATSGLRFPLESVALRRFAIRGSREMGEELVLDARMSRRDAE